MVNKKLIAICVLGMLLRIGWLFYCPYRPPFSYEEGHQKNYTRTEYDTINIHASNMTKGIWFRKESGEPWANRPIGYPVLLGLLYFFYGPRLAILYSLTLELQLITMLLIYLLTKEIFDKKTGLIATFIFSIYPISIYSTSLALDEHLFIPLWLCGIYLLVWGLKEKP